MHFDNCPNEILLEIFNACSSVSDIINLSATCSRFHTVLSARRLPILFRIAEAQYGPLEDAIQLVTYNASQQASVIRKVPESFSLLKQIMDVGKIALKWEMIYVFKKWKSCPEDRRFLARDEQFRLRRAIYRLWLYSRAFHNSRFTRYTRLLRQNVLERAELLHNWPTAELAEIEDVKGIIREVIQSQVCPSNGTIQRKFQRRYPHSDSHQLMFNIHLNYPPEQSPQTTAFQSEYYSHTQLTSSGRANSGNIKSFGRGERFALGHGHEPGCEGWGDDIPHYYVVEDMLKLDPAQVLWLKENAPLKGIVQSYVAGLGEWFDNNGETFGQTMEFVMGERGEDVEEIRELVQDRKMGIVVSEEE